MILLLAWLLQTGYFVMLLQKSTIVQIALIYQWLKLQAGTIESNAHFAIHVIILNSFKMSDEVRLCGFHGAYMVMED